MSLGEWWRKITGGTRSTPDAQRTEIHEPTTPSGDDTAVGPDVQSEDVEPRPLSDEERRTLQDEEIL